MKKVITTAFIGLAIGVSMVAGMVVGAVNNPAQAMAPQKYVNDIYRDSNNGVIGVFDDQTNKCYVYYSMATGQGGAGQAGKAIYCVKR